MLTERQFAFAAVVLLTTTTLLSAQPRSLLFVPDREISARLPIKGVPPIWAGGSLLGVEDSHTKAPVLYLVDRQGKRDEFLFSIPGSSLVGISGITLAQEGTIGLCGGVLSSEASGTRYIAVISPDHRQQTLIRTWPYQASQIALAPDGSIWTAGVITDDANTRIVTFNVLRRYDRSGKLLASWSVRANGRVMMGLDAVDASKHYLLASQDRVGWLAGGGEYFEYSLDGREIGRYAPPSGVIFDWPGAGSTYSHPSNDADQLHVLSAALSLNNEMLLCGFKEGKVRVWQLLRLDRQSRTWVAATPEQNGAPDIAGFDGDDPVLLPAVGELGRVQHFKRAAPHAQ